MAEIIMLDEKVKKKLIISGIVIAVIGLTLGFYFFYSHNLIFLKSTPKNNAKNVDIFSPINIIFNQKIPSASTSDKNAKNFVTISPAADIVTVTDGNTISISPVNLLTFNQKYTVTISNIVSQNGYTHKDVKLIFTTGYTDWNKLPDSVKQKYINQNDTNQTTAESPRVRLINSLPIDKPSFSLSYDSVSDSFDAVVKDDTKMTQTKNDITNYLVSFGDDPTTETIIYRNISGALLN